MLQHTVYTDLNITESNRVPLQPVRGMSKDDGFTVPVEQFV